MGWMESAVSRGEKVSQHQMSDGEDRRGMEMGQVDVSIILLTYNGIRYIDEVLRAIYRQQTSFPFEVIAIDSGSSDGTVDVLMSYPVRFYPIDKKQFGHGKTRNYGAELSRGQYLVF